MHTVVTVETFLKTVESVISLRRDFHARFVLLRKGTVSDGKSILLLLYIDPRPSRQSREAPV